MSENNNVDNVDIRIKVKAPTKAQIQRVNDSADALSRLQKVVSKNSGKSSTTNLKKLIGAEQGASKSTSALAGAMKGLKWGAVLYAGKKAVQTIGDWVNYSNDYVENMNLFSVSMGRYAEEAYNYGKQVEEVMGIDLSEWIRGQGVFNQIATGFGIAEDKAYTMSKGLTQLSYDLASFFNLDTEEAMNKVRSGISGELEPLRNLGYALDQATLKQVALDHGITKSINTMTQAEKAQLRYIAIMEQSENAIGDMARTLMSPANAQRVLTAQTDRLKRSLGQLFTPLAMKVIPVLTAITQLTTELVQDLAALVGFELPKIESTDAENNKAAWGEANEELQEYQRTLLGFDQINKMNGIKDTVSNIMGGDLGLDLSVYDYDFLGEANEEVDKIKEKISEFFNMFRNDTTVKAWTEALDSGFQTIVKVVEEVVGWVEPLYDNVIKPFADAVMPGIEKGFDNMNELFKEIRESAIWTTLKDTITSVSDALSPVSTTLGAIIGFLQEAVAKELIDGWERLATALDPVLKTVGAIADLLRGDFKGAIEKFSAAFDGFVEGLLLPIKQISKDLDAVFGTNLYEYFFGKEEEESDGPHRNPIYNKAPQTNPMLKAVENDVVNAARDYDLEAFGVDVKNYINPQEPEPPTRDATQEDLERWAQEEVNVESTFENMTEAMKKQLGYKKLGFATGGFPEDGLFFANHNELVGKFTNGKTAVANNEQIVSGIASGVRDANSTQNELLREQNSLLRQLIGITGNARATVTTHDIVEGARRLNRREGTTVIPVG